ncbi:dihydrofolate reductase family protein [Sinomonas mesophila]|uniref:dihydrofolate reductase family protein n=1 Tax=Sinomonas mesophila TaxID=1531955 RepID=UPI0009849292|nr:dihydrofolate reductase family protein [Sinomonas mesophila]
MGRLIIQDFVTVDGFAADTGGNFTFYEKLETRMDEFAANQLAWVEGLEAMVIGRNTYLMFAEYWPGATAEQDVLAPALNALDRHVFSSTLEAAPWGEDEPAVLERGDAVEAIRRIKAEAERDIVLWGSLRLGKSLLRAGEVDEVRLVVLPVALGEGIGVFPPAGDGALLRLGSARTYDDGLVELVYDVRPAG